MLLPDVKQYVMYGSGPRGLQSIIKLAKARALFNGRFHVAVADIKSVAKPALRHRILLNYEGEATGKTTDDIIEEILNTHSTGCRLMKHLILPDEWITKIGRLIDCNIFQIKRAS